MLASAMEAEAADREEEEKRRKAEEAAERERLEAEKKAEEKRKADELKKNDDFQLKKDPYIMIDVLAGVSEVAANHDGGGTAFRTLHKFLQSRVFDGKKFTPRCEAVLRAIHAVITAEADPALLYWPEDERVSETLGDFGFTIEAIRALAIDAFITQCDSLVTADVVTFYQFLESQGYDMWLEQRAYATLLPVEHTWLPGGKSKVDLIDHGTIEAIKDFAEVNYCAAEKVIADLQATDLRLRSKCVDEENKLKAPVASAQVAKPVEQPPEESKDDKKEEVKKEGESEQIEEKKAEEDDQIETGNKEV